MVLDGKRVMITADNLYSATIDSGHALTRPVFNSLLKHAVKDGLLPAPERDARMRGRPGLWTERDRNQWLDYLYLRSMRDRRDSIGLGLWLLGYRPAYDVKRTLTRTLDDLRALIAGQSLPLADIPEGAAFAVQCHLESAISPRLATKATYGWAIRDSTTYLFDIADEVSEDDHQRNETPYRMATFPRRTGTDALALADEYPRADIPNQQADVIRHHLLVERLLTCLGINGPIDTTSVDPTIGTLISSLSAAPDTAIDSARDTAIRQLSDVLRMYDWAPWQSHNRDESLDVRAILQQTQGESRLLFASPRLQPIATLLVAHTLAGYGEPDLGLIALAIKQLHGKVLQRHNRFNAAVLAVMAWETSFEPERRMSRGGLTEPWRPKYEEQDTYERRREAVTEFLVLHPHWKANEVASKLGASETFVKEVRATLGIRLSNDE